MLATAQRAKLDRKIGGEAILAHPIAAAAVEAAVDRLEPAPLIGDDDVGAAGEVGAALRPELRRLLYGQRVDWRRRPSSTLRPTRTRMPGHHRRGTMKRKASPKSQSTLLRALI